MESVFPCWAALPTTYRNVVIKPRLAIRHVGVSDRKIAAIIINLSKDTHRRHVQLTGRFLLARAVLLFRRRLLLLLPRSSMA